VYRSQKVPLKNNMIIELHTKRQFDIWKAILLCLMWCIRRERDEKIIQEEAVVGRLKNLFLRTPHKWNNAMNPSSSSSFFDFLDMLNSIT
jgi:hypothetical protein